MERYDKIRKIQTMRVMKKKDILKNTNILYNFTYEAFNDDSIYLVGFMWNQFNYTKLDDAYLYLVDDNVLNNIIELLVRNPRIKGEYVEFIDLKKNEDMNE